MGVLIICEVAIHGPMDWFKEASNFDFEYSSNIQLRIKIFFLS